MTSPRVYVLSSRHSPECARFFERAAKTNIDFLVPVLVDGQAARAKVLASPLNITQVPCVIGSVNGFVATYEGRDAFSWLEATIAELGADEPQPETPIDPEPVPERVRAHVSHKIDTHSLIERMRLERETDDNLVSDPRRRPEKVFDN